ncbi:sugar phosphate nucleotidyltransferase [Treponema sp.]
MQALMLAAGMGKRLRPYTQNATKCMVPINGKTLIEYCI